MAQKHFQDLPAASTISSTDVFPLVHDPSGTPTDQATTKANLESQLTLSNLGGTLGATQGGTGQTSFTDGQIMIGNTSTGGLTKATISAGANVTITNGNGSISIAATGGGGGGAGVTIQDDNVSVTPRTNLSFNAPITVTDDSGTNTTNVSLGTLLVAEGGTGATSASGARTNLGVAIGSNVQAFSSTLSALAGIAANGLIARTGSGAVSPRTLTAGSSKLAVTNGDGQAGNPTVDVTEANLTLNNVGGTLGVAKGGTGATTLTGILKGNGTSAITGGADTDSVPEGLTNLYYQDVRVQANRLDQLVAPSFDVPWGSQKITSLADPTSAQDAATKSYVDSIASGLDWKKSARAATTANGTLASSFANGTVIDGVTLATGDRVLIKNQASGAENGIYTVNTSGAPTRATDADANSEVTAGLAVFVEEGTTNADSGWVMTNDGTVTLGSTALTFVQFTGLGSVTAGTGLTKIGNTMAIDSTVATLAGSQTLTNKTITSPLGIVKGDVGLGSVDNTSDATKNAASVTLTNKTLTTPVIADHTNATHNHSNAAGGGQITDTALSAAVGIAKGGTGQTTATAALNALLPTQTGHPGTTLITDGSTASWGSSPLPIGQVAAIGRGYSNMFN